MRGEVIVFQGYKSYVASLLLIVAGALPGVLSGTDWQQFMVDPKTGMGMLIGGVVMAVMRKITTQTTVKAALQAPPPDSAG